MILDPAVDRSVLVLTIGFDSSFCRIRVLPEGESATPPNARTCVHLTALQPASNRYEPMIGNSTLLFMSGASLRLARS